MEAITNFSVESASYPELTGKLAELQRAAARLEAGLLRAALELTRRPTSDNPEGEIFITPAVRHIMGDSKLSTGQAADVIKRLRRRQMALRDVSSDPLLAQAYERAMKQRPKGSAKSTESEDAATPGKGTATSKRESR